MEQPQDLLSQLAQSRDRCAAVGVRVCDVLDHAVRTLPMMFFTLPKQPPIFTGVPVPYPNTIGAPSTGQVLLFDEADEIFAKRAEVRSSRRP